MARALLFVKDMFSFFQSKLMMIPFSRSVLQDRKSPLPATQPNSTFRNQDPAGDRFRERLECTSFTSTRLLPTPSGSPALEAQWGSLPGRRGRCGQGTEEQPDSAGSCLLDGKSSGCRLQLNTSRIDMVTPTPSKSLVSLLLVTGM